MNTVYFSCFSLIWTLLFLVFSVTGLINIGYFLSILLKLKFCKALYKFKYINEQTNFLQQFELTAKSRRKQRVSAYALSPSTQPHHLGHSSVVHTLQMRSQHCPIIASQNSHLHLASLCMLHNLSFDKHIITCIHHYNTLLSSFSGQKSLCSAYSSPLPLKPLELLVFLPCPHSCLFQDAICSISLSMQPFRLTSSTT